MWFGFLILGILFVESPCWHRTLAPGLWIVNAFAVDIGLLNMSTPINSLECQLLSAAPTLAEFSFPSRIR
jgi:hypothetical protein